MAEKRILDEATRAQLRGFTPFSTEATISFTPEEFENIADVTLRPAFQLSPFTQAQKDQIAVNSKSYAPDMPQEKIFEIAAANKEVLRGCVKGWSNLYDAGTGEEIEFSKEAFNTLPGFIISGIRTSVEKISGLSEVTKLGLK
jgi:hypothetical protein